MSFFSGTIPQGLQNKNLRELPNQFLYRLDDPYVNNHGVNHWRRSRDKICMQIYATPIK